MLIIHTKAQWLAVVERLRSGEVRFSTGRQESGAAELANFIEGEVYGQHVSDETTIELELSPDEALSVAQALGWTQINVASLFRGFL